MSTTVSQPPLQHLAIIMDGNGRWAEAQGQPRVFGHKNGAQNVRTIVEYVRRQNIPYLTLYAFSTENWRRSGYEVSVIMRLLKLFTKKEIVSMKQNDIRVRFIGRRDGLTKPLLSAMEAMENETAGGGSMLLQVAIDYGGRNEIVRAAEALAESGEVFTESAFASYLDTKDAPDVDLVVRTGGNERLSNFMLWQNAYAELRFTDTMWPAFSPDELDLIIKLFCGTERRFGGLPEAAE